MEKTLGKNLKALWRNHRSRFIYGFIMVLISNTLLVINPILMRSAIKSISTLQEPHIQSILSWAAILLCIAATSAFFKYWMRMMLINISRDAEKDLRAKLFERIQAQSQAFFDRHGTGELLSRLTNDIAAYRDMLGPGITFPFHFITLVIPGSIALFFISPTLAFIALFPLLAIPLLNSAVRQHIYRLSQAVQDSLSQMSNLVQEHFVGIRIIKAYAVENNFLSLLKKMCRHFASISFRLSCLQGTLIPLFALCAKAVTIFLIMVSGIIILGNFGKLTIGDFVSFMWIQSYLFIPVLMMGWILPIYERGRAAYKRLEELYVEPIEVKDNSGLSLKIPTKPSIVFKDLLFSYPNSSERVLQHLNLEIEGGSVVGITGPTGAGKSTLLRLLNRDYELPEGMVFIGGNEIHEYSLKAIREELILVEQSSFLFSKSVAENVRFGNENATQQELETAAEYASLHEEVMGFPKQYETQVGERGVMLSGGQKQRVAIARALLVKRSILLLDDIFSAVDVATEQRIFEAIRNHFLGRTVILVTHRISILERMDRVIYMMQGQIVEDGTPQALMEKNGYYAALAELQYLTR